MLNDEKVIKVDSLARERNLDLGFITIVDILKMEKVCRDVDEAHKDFQVYDKLCDKGIDVEFENVIALLEIEKDFRMTLTQS